MSVLVVTGGGRGIGAAICRLAADHGYDVVVNYATDHRSAESVAADIRAKGRAALAVQADVTDEAAVDHLFAQADTLGPLTALVANAAITGNLLGRLEDVPLPTFRHVMDTNTTGVFLPARAALRRMSTRHGGHGGAIVVISSTAARRSSPGEWVHYAASKAAVETLAHGLSIEVAPDGVRVNTVSPGTVRTDLHAAAGAPDRPDRVATRIPLGRPGEPEEIAEAALWLLSPKASFTTGATLHVSGGY